MLNDEELKELGQQLRVDAVRATRAAGSGHTTSALSAADLIAVLAAHHLRYDPEKPGHPGNDRLVFSKGHATPLLYAMYTACGMITPEELETYRQAGSRLEGHPTPALPWVDVATGSLGQGLPIGAGLALAARRFEELDSRVWVLCGDSELSEGSMWEALEFAAAEGLANLTAVVDVNRLGQRGPTRHQWDLGAYHRRIGAFGWAVIEVDGHDPRAIDEAYSRVVASPTPTAILARTRKGAGVSEAEDQEGMHGKALAEPDRAISELGGVRTARIDLARPDSAPARPAARTGALRLPDYEPGSHAATRTAFGQAVTALARARGDVVLLDGEVADSTRAQYFAEAHPERFVECHIAEQQMIAAAVGLQARGWVPYAATFAAFLTRAYDFVRMAAVGRARLNLVGSHAGVAIGRDGPSQMGLEDIATMRAVYGSAVLHPCDAPSAARLTAAMAEHPGIAYLRTLRGDTPVLYGPELAFTIGGSALPRSSPQDRATVVAAGVTVHEALQAADSLAEEGISVRVMDAYSIKPLDMATLRTAAEETGHMLTVEDHRPEGGLGDAVAGALADAGLAPRLRRLAVSRMPDSAAPEEQLHAAGIDAEAIAAAVRELLA
jgi:transketolase